MSTWDDVRTAALRLPEASEVLAKDGRRSWQVAGKTFAWERPLGKSDLRELGPAAPQGPLVAFRTADLVRKEDAIAAVPEVLFTIPHFDGHPAVLARLERLDGPLLEQLLKEAWRDRAPPRLTGDPAASGRRRKKGR